MQFDDPNSLPKLNGQTALAAAVVGGVSLVPFVLATPHHAPTEVVNQVNQHPPTVELAAAVEEEALEPPFLLAGPKYPSGR